MSQEMPKQHLGAHIGPAPTNRQLGITMISPKNANSEVIGGRVRSVCCKSFYLMIGILESGNKQISCATCGHPID